MSFLDQWFIAFNKKYFDGLLLDVKLIVEAVVIDNQPAAGKFDLKEKSIYINKTSFDDYLKYQYRDKKFKKHKKELKGVLLHEMTHAYLSLLSIQTEEHSDAFCLKYKEVLMSEFGDTKLMGRNCKDKNGRWF